MFDIKSLFNKEVIILACTQLCFGVIGALLVQGLTFHQAPRIATVNITALVDSFVKETAKQSLPPLQMKQNVSAFGERLNKTIEQLAREKHLILVPSEAVIAGSPDLTQEVAESIKREVSP